MLSISTLRKTSCAASLAASILLGPAPASTQPSFFGAEYLEQDTGFIPDTSEAVDLFGAAVAHGDFNCDGYQDLAIGVPEEDLKGGLTNAGQVTVIFGSSSGLDPTTSLFLSQSLGLLAGGSAGVDFRFGATLAAGNFDNSTFLGRPCDDLAIGVPGMSYLVGVDAVQGGAVIVIPSISTGLSVVDSRRLTSGFTAGSAEDGDAFGSAMAAGDFNGDGYDDLAIGAPGEDIGGATDAGRVRVIYGSEFGLSAADSPFLHSFNQASFGALVETGDRFGSVLVAGDFNRSIAPTYDDLVVGIPDEDVGTLEDAGAIIAIYGSVTGLTATGSEIFTQNNVPIAGIDAESFNLFGASLAVGDFDGDTADDLAIGSPGANQTFGARGLEVTAFDVGVVHVLYGVVGDALTDIGDVLFRRDNWFGTFGANDLFGFAVAAGDFDFDGLADLAVGAPGGDQDGAIAVGVVHIFTGAQHFGRFDAGTTLFQDGADLGLAELADNFGWALTAGDFDNDGLSDLGVGVPTETTANGASVAGAVNVFYSGPLFFDGFESGDASAWP